MSAKINADGDPGALADHIIAMFEAPFDPAKLGVEANHLGAVIA